MINFNDPIFNCAKRRGYLELATINPEEFEMSFVGQWVKKYKNDLKVLSMLSELVGKKLVEWSDLTERTLKRFKEMVLNTMCANSAKTIFAKMKSILNDMKREVKLPCVEFDKILSVKEEDGVNIYLTEDEIKLFEQVEIRDESERYVHSMFLMSAYTGCRHSDALKMNRDNIFNGKVSYVSQKTGIFATIPLHHNLANVMESFDHDIKMFDYKYNEILRELCFRSQLVRRVKVRKAGKDTCGCLYQFVSSHTARRSFATNLYMRGVDIYTIMKLMGHRNTSTTWRYICDTRGVGEQAMQFFN